MSNTYLPAQMSGPLATAVEQRGIAEFSTSDDVLVYLSTLNLDTVDADVLAILGELIGLPWPTVPVGTYSNTNFTLISAASFPQYSNLTGLGSVDNPAIGGWLTSVDLSSGTRIPIGLYRQVLKLCAQIKQEGLTLKTVDALVSIFTLHYTVTWNSFHDLVVTFNPDLDTGSLYTLNLILGLFTIDPIVVLVQI